MLYREKLHDVYLSLGSNLGDRGENLHHAIDKIEERIGEVIATSAFYVTDPVGFASENQFLNAACLVRTSLKPFEVLTITQYIEKEMGRQVKSYNKVYIDRTIDIDILLYDNEVIDTDTLIIPHPNMNSRAFVILPLSEIAAQVVHPISNKTIEAIWSDLKANSKS